MIMERNILYPSGPMFILVYKLEVFLPSENRVIPIYPIGGSV